MSRLQRQGRNEAFHHVWRYSLSDDCLLLEDTRPRGFWRWLWHASKYPLMFLLTFPAIWLFVILTVTLAGKDFLSESRMVAEILFSDPRGTPWLIMFALSALIAAGFFALEPWRETMRFEMDSRQGLWRYSKTLCGRTWATREGPLTSIVKVEAETPDEGMPLNLTVSITGANGKTRRHMLRNAMQPADYPDYQKWIQRALGSKARAPGPRILRKKWEAERGQ